MKFTEDIASNPELSRFVQRAVDHLDRQIDLYDYDLALCNAIRNQNILIVDDVTTSGSTLNEILRALRVLNEDNKTSIFSLLGRKDLMVEK